jgi:hypothetical protein
MTVLRLVRDTDPSDTHSRRVPPTDEQLADLQWINKHVLPDADLAVAELRHAVVSRNHAAAIVACNRLLGAGLVWRDVKAGMQP